MNPIEQFKGCAAGQILDQNKHCVNCGPAQFPSTDTSCASCPPGNNLSLIKHRYKQKEKHWSNQTEKNKWTRKQTNNQKKKGKKEREIDT